MATAEWLLSSLARRPDKVALTTLLVEPTPADMTDADGVDGDIIDFAIECDGAVTDRVQVKASVRPTVHTALNRADAAKIFARLAGTGSGSTPVRLSVLTNRQLAPALLAECTEDVTDNPDQRLYRYGPSRDASDAGQSVIRVDPRSPNQLKQSLLGSIRALRRDRALGRGETSATLLAALLLTTIFDSAAGLGTRRIPAQDVWGLLSLSDGELAHAAGRFDWGTPVNEVPLVSSVVPRLSYLNELAQLFEESTTTRQPRVAVLAGETGFGKSTIAADFCHLNRHFYEKVCWIDCRKPELISAQIKDITTRLTPAAADSDRTADAFRTAIGESAGPFLLIFDGAGTRADIEPYLPTSGSGFVVVTTTNSTTWWPSCDWLEVTAISDNEAVRCFQRHANIEPGTNDGAVRGVVQRLGGIPLAISMAANYFRNSQEDIEELSARYFDDLAALDDSMAVPAGYDRTAFAAVRFAVEQIGKAAQARGQFGRESQALLYHASFLSPDRIPVNLLLQTVHPTTHVDLMHPPAPVVADQTLRNAVITNIRTQTLARRERYVDGDGQYNPASDTLTIHPLVHEILRKIHTRSAPPGVVDDLFSVLMTTLYGWILELRNRGDYFPVEQVRDHALTVLGNFDRVARTASPSEQRRRYTEFAQLFLGAEVATAYAGRSDFETSVAISEAAVARLHSRDLPDYVRVRLILTLSQATIDASFSGADEHQLVSLAGRLRDELDVAAQREGTEFHAVIRNSLHAMGALARTPHRQNPELVRIARAIYAIGQRLPSETEDNDTSLIQKIQSQIQRGEFHDALAMIPSLRAVSKTLHTALAADAFEAVAMLHLDRFGEALVRIDRVLDDQNTRNLVRMHLSLGLRDIENALNATEGRWGVFDELLQDRAVRVTQLSRELDLTSSLMPE
ncbi:hypothetical protein AWH04_03490 [Rhodococcus erythropolis]|nr:hypothetical protein AWH04_03490 [Rhodococcus erythropolis]